MSKVWIGGIYLKEEGGYEIILKSLIHYRKRLKTIGRSPELKDAPMFVQLVQHEASKTGPLIDQAISKIKNGLENSKMLSSLESDIQVLEKALNCYQSDIQKIQNGDTFYLEFIADKNEATSDLPKIQNAMEKIKQYL